MRMAAFIVCITVVVPLFAEDKKPDEKKVVHKVTAAEIAKEFKDDPKAAQKKYQGAEIQLSGAGEVVIGPVKDSELVQTTESKVTIRIGIDKRPAKFPAKYTATASFKSYFEPGRELALVASKIVYTK
jgi:hypothetical protein